MKRNRKILCLLLAGMAGAAVLQAASLEIYRDGAIYRYVPVDDYVGFLSRGEARCGDRSIALEKRPSCPESKRLCKEKADLDKIKKQLRTTQETLKVLSGIEKAIKPAELSADKWISTAEKTGAKRAELLGISERLQRESQAKEERFHRQSSAREALFLSRTCKESLALTLPPGLIKLGVENEAELLENDLLKITQFLSLTNRSGVDISVKDARIYARNFRRTLRPIRFSPWVVRPAPPRPTLRSKKAYKAVNEAADRVMLAAAPVPVMERVEKIGARNYAVGKLDLPSTGESVRVRLGEYQVKSRCEAIAYPYRDRSLYRACRFKPKEEIVTDRWTLKKGRRILSDRVYGEYKEGNYLLYVDRDESVSIRRERLVEKERSSGIFGGEIRKRDGYIIEVDNRSGKKKSLTLVDRIPRSTTEKIRVKLLKVSGATKESLKDNGELIMKLELDPGESRTVKVLFELRYDKDLKVLY